LIWKTMIPASISIPLKIGMTKFCDRYFVICDLILWWDDHKFCDFFLWFVILRLNGYYEKVIAKLENLVELQRKVHQTNTLPHNKERSIK
jgi:hypothetical protein